MIAVAGSISEPIKGILKETNILRVIRVNKSFILLHIKNFSNVSVQERHLNIKLNDLHIIFGCDSYDQANNSNLTIGPTLSRETRFFNDGVGALPKVLEVYMGKVVWPHPSEAERHGLYGLWPNMKA